MRDGGRTLLMIGGTGFFGKSVLDAFRRGLLAPWGVERVIVASRYPETLRIEHADLVGAGVELLALDIGTAHALPNADFIIHAANTSDARRYAAAPQAERAAILSAATNFARLVAAGDRTTKIVYTSSGAVYGAQPSNVERLEETHRPADVRALADYKRDYAEAKLLAEQEVARLGRDHDLAVSVARCFAFVGRYLPRDQHFAIGNFLADGNAGRPIVVKALHPVIRSYLYADDLVVWLMTIADNATPDCPVFNVGSDEAIEVTDLARRIGDLYGVPVDHGAQTARPVDRYIPSIARAADRLGLVVRYDLDTALALSAGRDLKRDGDRSKENSCTCAESAVY